MTGYKEENELKDKQLETAEKCGKIKAFIGLVKEGTFTAADAAERIGMSTEEFEKLMNT
ncbi:MAG: hypothetical protein ILP22_09265 [Oscillospiraceae bacterium]|nr:hypothetical protein [Oscillospiraceae bacterium]